MPKFHDLLRTTLQHGDLRVSFVITSYSFEALQEAARNVATDDYYWIVYQRELALTFPNTLDSQRMYVVQAMKLAYEGRKITWDLPLSTAILSHYISLKQRALTTQARIIDALEEMFSYPGGDLIARADCRDRNVSYRLTPDVERVRKLLKQLFGSKMYRRLLRAYDRYQCQFDMDRS